MIAARAKRAAMITAQAKSATMAAATVGDTGGGTTNGTLGALDPLRMGGSENSSHQRLFYHSWIRELLGNFSSPPPPPHRSSWSRRKVYHHNRMAGVPHRRLSMAPYVQALPARPIDTQLSSAQSFSNLPFHPSTPLSPPHTHTPFSSLPFPTIPSTSHPIHPTSATHIPTTFYPFYLAPSLLSLHFPSRSIRSHSTPPHPTPSHRIYQPILPHPTPH